MTLASVSALLSAVHGTQAAPAVSQARLDVSLIGTAPAGSEGLQYFVGEVSRALAEELRRDGIAVSATGEVPIVVTLEERPGDRVALSAKTRGHHVELEGTVESLDALVDELATRIVPLCAPQVSSVPNVETHRPNAQRPPAHVAVSITPTSTPMSPVVVTPPPQNPAPTPATIPVPPTAVPAPVAPPVADPPVVAARSPIVDPYGPDARVGDAQAQTSFIRSRVVVHSMYDPADAPQGTGSMATQALYAVLQHNLRLSIVPMGAGLVSISSAADESQRAQARVVVMGRLDNFAYYQSQSGPVARLRLELEVVSDGRLVLRRALYAETPVNAVAAAIAEGRRGRNVDPVFIAVTRALESEVAELQVALLGPNNGAR